MCFHVEDPKQAHPFLDWGARRLSPMRRALTLWKGRLFPDSTWVNSGTRCSVPNRHERSGQLVRRVGLAQNPF